MHKQIFKPHKRFKFFEFSDYGLRNCIKKSVLKKSGVRTMNNSY